MLNMICIYFILNDILYGFILLTDWMLFKFENFGTMDWHGHLLGLTITLPVVIFLACEKLVGQK